MKQSSIEWLVEQFEKIVFYSEEAKEDVINQAKEMHKQEIIEARNDGFDSTYAEYIGEKPELYLYGSSEEYYNETNL